MTDGRKRSVTHSMARIIFITGTDTGVGKTLLTGLLLHHLRRSGCHALAMKPFCSGSRADAEFLHAVQDGELTPEEINPFFFAEPLAPLVAARKHQRVDPLAGSVAADYGTSPAVASVCSSRESGECWCPWGRVFGAGFDRQTALRSHRGFPQRLGTINHTLLTVDALQHIGIQGLKVVLMASLRKQISPPIRTAGFWRNCSLQARFCRCRFLGRNPAANWRP